MCSNKSVGVLTLSLDLKVCHEKHVSYKLGEILFSLTTIKQLPNKMKIKKNKRIKKALPYNKIVIIWMVST